MKTTKKQRDELRYNVEFAAKENPSMGPRTFVDCYLYSLIPALDDLDTQAAEIERLKEALEFYADPDTYRETNYDEDDGIGWEGDVGDRIQMISDLLESELAQAKNECSVLLSRAIDAEFCSKEYKQMFEDQKKQCEWLKKFIERAQNYVHMGIGCPNCCTKDMQRFNSDLAQGFEKAVK